MNQSVEYESEDVLVVCERSAQAQAVPLVVTFASALSTRETRVRMLGESSLRALGVHQAHVHAYKGNVWQVPEMGAAMAAIKQFALAVGATEVLMHGASIGGYGALIFAPMLGASRVLTYAPQYTVDYRKMTFDTRLEWPYYHDAVRSLMSLTDADGRFPWDDMEACLNAPIDRIVLFDPVTYDAGHARQLIAHRTVLHPLSHASHAVSRFLHQTGHFADVLAAFVAGDLAKLADVVADARKRRWQSELYRSHFVADRKMVRKHPALLLHALRWLVQLEPKDLAVHRALVELYLERGETELARKAAGQAENQVPSPPPPGALFEQAQRTVARRRQDYEARLTTQASPAAG